MEIRNGDMNGCVDKQWLTGYGKNCVPENEKYCTPLKKSTY